MRQTIAPPSDPPRLTPNPEQIAEPWREVVDPKEAQMETSVRGTDGRGPLLTPSTSTKSPLLSDQGDTGSPTRRLLGRSWIALVKGTTWLARWLWSL
jgi:hypothetical protein